MKYATLFIRITIGIVFLVTSIGFFLKLFPQPTFEGDFKAFQLGLVASSYLMPLAKSVELICGLSFITGRYVTLANILIFPVTINIVFINFFLTPQGIPFALFVFFGNLFLIFSHWENYKSLFKAK
ncbi:DoxX family protein [Flavobacterium cellulosilyticum]|uniref:DoxX family membrane protein n=1 Tax=Flavobacterium cellulosilyticum TaxID=2541731 RepID=A0A4R5C6S5_9FLAO|nr:DoxX family membrane protein [Flavobacterium cellulosilyticum]TDD95481.1 DoxX family membrane protein [Flavobacterium cellulosilyticum]